MISRFRKYSRVLHADVHRRVVSRQDATWNDGGSLEERAVKLRKILEGWGPIGSSFALYLSSRIDLLPAEYCRELKLTPDIAPISLSTVKQVMSEDLGPSVHRLFKEFSPSPVRANLIGQTHAAELVSGDKVAVFVRHPEYDNADRVGKLAGRLDNARISDLVTNGQHGVIEDFGAALGRETDLRLRREAVASAASEVAPMHLCRFYGELSGKKVLTLSFCEETCLNQLMQRGGYDLAALGVALCHRWLWESLNGRFCPVDPSVGNIFISGPRAIRFNGNEFVELPRRTKDSLRLYLLATSEDEPERAAGYLLQEMTPPNRGVNDVGEFRSRFRQAAYFGALEPILGTNTNALAQLVFQHWKTALDFGYTPTPDLLCFYRGLFSIARVVRRLAPTDDPLREGLEELNASMVFSEVKKLASAGYWLDNSDKLAMAMLNIPRALDAALDRTALPDLEEWSGPMPPDSGRERRSPFAGLTLAAAVIIFILQEHGKNWMENSMVMVLMIAGLIALGVCDE